jgi:short subunit dehydrogenase-like uncharacterized protein
MSESANERAGEWMIYGAYGYTGQLVAAEAVRRGHRPVLAGRAEKKLAPVAERLGLDWVAVDLRDTAALAQAVAQVELVFHAAGPFVHTSAPMLRACLVAGTHYVDITGELPVFENTFAHDQAALQRGIALISGVGFDVIPTDCLAEYVVNQVPNAVELEIAIAAISRASAGTAKTMLEIFPGGGRVRREGRLVPYRWGKGARRLRFSHREHNVVPVTWGDLATAFQTTGVPNITTYMAFPTSSIRLLRWMSPLGQRVLALKPVRRLFQKWAEKRIHGPDEETRRTGRAYVWARAADERGRQAQAWLETLETYQFTAVGGVRCVERILQERPQGALTPALALGADFVLEIEGSRRFDALPSD